MLLTALRHLSTKASSGVCGSWSPVSCQCSVLLWRQQQQLDWGPECPHCHVLYHLIEAGLNNVQLLCGRVIVADIFMIVLGLMVRAPCCRRLCNLLGACRLHLFMCYAAHVRRPGLESDMCDIGTCCALRCKASGIHVMLQIRSYMSDRKLIFWGLQLLPVFHGMLSVPPHSLHLLESVPAWGVTT